MFKLLFKFKRIRAYTLIRQKKVSFSDKNLAHSVWVCFNTSKKKFFSSLNAAAFKASVRFFKLIYIQLI